MTAVAQDIIQRAGAAGVRLWVENDSLCFEGNTATTEALLPELIAFKPALLVLLRDTDLPEPWNRIRILTAAGWRADFAVPDAEGQQAITWTRPEPATRIPKIAAGETLYQVVRVTDATGTLEYHTLGGMTQAEWWAFAGQHHTEPFHVEVFAENGKNQAPAGSTVAPSTTVPASTSTTPVRCADCAHREPVEWHPALVGCKATEPAPGACGLFWSLDPRYCRQFTKAV